jgi:hypothetical protein
MIDNAVKELKIFLETSIFSADSASFAVLYGGSVYKPLSQSDLDFAIVTSNATPQLQREVESFIIQLHDKYNLRLDDEVPFNNKLIYHPDEVFNAIHLSCFINNDKTFEIQKIEKTAEFLSSPQIKARLILNALTTPHEFWGNSKSGSHAEIQSGLAIIVLAIELVKKDLFDGPALFNALTISKDGEWGEDFLGYKYSFDLVADYLNGIIVMGLSVLEDEGFIKRGADGFYKKVATYDPVKVLMKVLERRG